MSGLEHTLIDELTPPLKLDTWATCHYERGQVVVEWFESSFSFPISDLELHSSPSAPSVTDCLLAYVYRHAPVTQMELERCGISVRTSGGRECYVKRGDHYRQVSLQEITWSLTPLQTPLLRDFSTTITGGLVTVDSKHRLPHESVSHGSDFLRGVLRDVLVPDMSTLIAIAAKPHKPVVVGHHALMQRFCEDMGARTELIALSDLDTFR